MALGARSSKDAQIEYPLKYERKEHRIQKMNFQLYAVIITLNNSLVNQ